jgi:hypothetical protein
MEQIGVKHIKNVAPRVVANTLTSARTLFLQIANQSIKTLSGKQTAIILEHQESQRKSNVTDK